VAKPKAKIPRISIGVSTHVEIAEAQWKRIESDYGHTLDDQIRAKIIAATNKFVRFAEAESNAGLLSDAIGRVASCRKHASSLLETFKTSTKTSAYADDLVQLKINLAIFRDDLTKFVEACSFALDEMGFSSQFTYWPDGWAWEVWIRELIATMEQAGLPAKVRKDSTSNASSVISPFAKFVSQLQSECIPANYCRSLWSNEALSKTISDARVVKVPGEPKKKAISARRRRESRGTDKPAT
jgi:hypothetical protein